MPRGGVRPGAGRKPKAELYARQIASSEKSIAGGMADLVATMQRLAEGGYERETRHEEPAGMLYRDDYEAILDKDGVPNGKVRKVRVLAFPDLPPEQMICVKRTVETADGDRQAVSYLLDRIMGKPGSEDQTEQYERVFEEIKGRLVSAMDGLDADTREQIKAQLRRG